MAKITMEIVLNEDLKCRLEACAALQEKTLQLFIQDALYTYVEDIEDGVMSNVALSEEGLQFYSGRRGDDIDLAGQILEVSRKTA